MKTSSAEKIPIRMSFKRNILKESKSIYSVPASQPQGC